jgi:S1-C subfamily serine protease
MIRQALLVICLIAGSSLSALASPGSAPMRAIADSLPKVVKIHGAGGTRGLEPYQSGFLISPTGHVLTAWSYVLDTDSVRVTLDDGRRFEATLVGADPRLEVAVLKIDAADLPHFDLSTNALVENGARVLALSNLFGIAAGDEAASVQRGVVMARTQFDARRGTFASAYHGPVYVLDAVTNNPGAAGGALVTQQGELLGILGKELRNARNNSWINYAIPNAELKPAVDAILAGKPRTKETENKLDLERAYNLALLGLALVPDVLEKTPPYIDEVRPGSPADKAGLKPDDLVIFIGEALVPSCRSVQDELARLERGETLKWVVKRGDELIEAELKAE